MVTLATFGLMFPRSASIVCPTIQVSGRRAAKPRGQPTASLLAGPLHLEVGLIGCLQLTALSCGRDRAHAGHILIQGKFTPAAVNAV